MKHVVLLGDSIFDNASYVPGQPDVIRQTRTMLPADWKATLCAVDGAVTRGVSSQLKRIPPDASHLVISVGGNDALHASRILHDSVRLVSEALLKLSDIREAFETDYRAMLDAVMALNLPTTLCTIYEGYALSDLQQRIQATGLTVFNDVILREAFFRRLSVIDLRFICNDPDDYANPIEPSAKGGEKIAAVIAGAVAGPPDPSTPQVHVR
ncbi:SGNH/GDSL hydrolase family protein [Microvirga rosea]|uniref:SGNH/GDSL hydrolase family protein n=1 Tax=Microvirga rosea TaxID=2715425 RepID=UPI001D0BB3CE|nr:SGNH/GDSL hydrolase family protein [Microvirga rosea]MCB8820277.1 SGNH/GDSL hydrolase family protein [Microvirga rosea]